jgi:hypothetical protein
MIKQIIKWWKRDTVRVQRVEMNDEKFMWTFNVDPATPFYCGVMELIERLKEKYIDEATNLLASERTKLDAIAALGALQELQSHLLTNVNNVKMELERRSKRGKSDGN